MIKKMIAVAMAIAVSTIGIAQAVLPTTITVEEVNMPGYSVSVKKDIKVVKNALEKQLADVKLKTKKVDGCTAVLGQAVPNLSDVPINAYFKVEEKGKKKDKVVEISLAALPSNDNVALYLENFVRNIDRYEASLSLEVEQKNLEKANKELSKATSTVASLDKTIQSKQDKIASKQKDIENYRQKIADCEKDIDDLNKEIQKAQSDREDALRREGEAQQKVRNVEGEVQRYEELSR